MSHFISQTAFYTPSSGFSHLRCPPISGGRIGVRAHGDRLGHYFEPDEPRGKKRNRDYCQTPINQPVAKKRLAPSADTHVSSERGRMTPQYKMRFDMPGMTKEDVKVWVEEKKIKIPGDSSGAGGWQAKSYGRYIGIALPENVEFEKIEDEVKDGVLYITIH